MVCISCLFVHTHKLTSVQCLYVYILLASFIDDIDNFNDKLLICRGDWNLVLDEKDKKGGSTKLSHTKNREKLKSFIDRNNLTDV